MTERVQPHSRLTLGCQGLELSVVHVEREVGPEHREQQDAPVIVIVDASPTGVDVVATLLEGALVSLSSATDPAARRIQREVRRVEHLCDTLLRVHFAAPASRGADPVAVTQPLSSTDWKPRAARGAIEQTTRLSTDELLEARNRAETIRGSRRLVTPSPTGPTPTTVANTERLPTVLGHSAHESTTPSDTTRSHGTAPMSWEELEALHRRTAGAPAEPRLQHHESDTDQVTMQDLAALARQAKALRSQR